MSVSISWGCLLAIALMAGISMACAGSAVAPGPSTSPTEQASSQVDRGTIAFSLRGNIYTVRPDGSELQRLLEPANESYSAPEFSPDGQRLAYIVNRKRVVVVDAGNVSNILSDIDLFLDRTPPTPIASNWSMGPVAVHWSPDGTMLLVTRQRLGGSGASDVLVMNVSGTELRIVLNAGVFIEATWWREPDGTPRILVVGADTSRNAITYDLDGAVVGRGLPATATRSAVASLQHPDGSSVLVRSALGSPVPFGPIEIHSDDEPWISAGGCGATWSPDGEQIAFYSGSGIALKDPDAAPDDVDLIVTNADLGLEGLLPSQLEETLPESACFGLGISWSSNAGSPEQTESSTARGLFLRPFHDENLGIEFELANSWHEGAAPMPYFSCFDCVTLGPADASPPYGVTITQVTELSGNCAEFPRCGTGAGVFAANRTFFDGEELELTVSDYLAVQQRTLVQPPLGLTNHTGEQRLYHQVSTYVDKPGATDLMIVGFYREDDEVGELEVELAYEALLESLVIEE